MLDALYLKSIEKKEEIHEFFQNITKDIDRTKVKEKYNNCDFDKKQQDKNFAAIDGSYNKIKFMAGYVYAITSQTIISKHNQDVQKESQAVDINTISTIHNRKIDTLLSLQMSIFELKSTIDTLKRHPDIDYMLMDGSISGTLNNYRQPEIPQELHKTLNEISYKFFQNELEKEEISLDIITEKNYTTIETIITNIIHQNNLDIEYEDIKLDIIMCLEGFEELFCINYLLKHFKEKIICISKTSSTKSLFQENIPDIAVLEYVCDNSGYTNPTPYDSMKPFRYVGQSKRQIDFPILNRDLANTPYHLFFTKLEDKSQVLKIEIPQKFEDEQNIITILNNLESISVNGYPHILKKAHDEVKIETKYMQRITRDIRVENTEDRSVLN